MIKNNSRLGDAKYKKSPVFQERTNYPPSNDIHPILVNAHSPTSIASSNNATASPNRNYPNALSRRRPPSSRPQPRRATFPLTDLSSPSSGKRRRKTRYDLAESHLSTSFSRYLNRGLSHRDLQIKALEQISAALNALAEEAQGQADEIRVALADRDVDPVIYRTRQCERWRMERRTDAARREAKLVSQQLDQLKSPEHGEPKATFSSGAKRKSNLARFINSSNTRIPITKHRNASRHPTRPSFVIQHRKINDKKPHSKSMFPLPLKLNASVKFERNYHLKWDLAPSGSSSRDNESKLDSSRVHPAPELDRLPSTPKPAPPPSTPLKRGTLSAISESEEFGTAVIYSSPTKQSGQDTLRNFDVTMPEYALKLFRDFEGGASAAPELQIPSFAIRQAVQQQPQSNTSSSPLTSPPIVVAESDPPPSPPVSPKRRSRRPISAILFPDGGFSARLGLFEPKKTSRTRREAELAARRSVAIADSSAVITSGTGQSMASKIARRFSVRRD